MLSGWSHHGAVIKSIFPKIHCMGWNGPCFIVEANEHVNCMWVNQNTNTNAFHTNTAKDAHNNGGFSRQYRK